MSFKVTAPVLLLSALSFVALPSDASSVAVIVPLDPSTGQLPESITVDGNGNVILSLAAAASVFKVIPDGQHTPVLIASLPVAAGAFSSGVKVGADGNVYVLSAAFNPALDASAVWRVTPAGAVSEVAHLTANGFPNDLAFDDEGNLFVTDSTLGQIYKIDGTGGVSVWLSDPRLLGNVQHPVFPGLPFGVDGIAFDKMKHNLYVTNFDFGEIFRIPVNGAGGPGSLATFASDPRLAGSDGIAFDKHGNGDLYVAVNAQNQIAEIDGSGSITIVASGAPLDNPSSLVFGPDGNAKKTLYISSFAVTEAFGIVAGTPHPSLDSMDVPFGGLPLL